MILSGHQPVYLPSIQLFNKIWLSDAFMFVGHCAYTPKSWHSHNFIRNPGNGDEPLKLSVPVRRSATNINGAEIDSDHWRKKHLKSIKMAYISFPFFPTYYPTLEAAITWPPTLGCLNAPLIRQICQWLQIDTKLYYSQAFAIEGNKTDMIIDMCRKTQATQYLSNEGARAYVDEKQLLDAGIIHRWQSFTQPDYGQDHWGQPLSILDLLFARGPESGEIVKKAGEIAREAGHVG